LTPTLIYVGEKYSNEWIPANSATGIAKIDPTFYGNINFTVNNFLYKNTAFSFAIYNFTDANLKLAVPYGLTESLPTQSRTYYAKLSANF
jgi:hypothetical protein